MQRKAIVIGATGLVGAKLVKQLVPLYQTLIVIARHPPKYMTGNMRFYQLQNFANLPEVFTSLDLGSNTDAFSCLGTTKKQAGSEDGFRLVDYDYNLSFARLCHDKGVRRFFLLSALGADINSRFFYNQVKGETEHAITQVGFAHCVLFRPSLLLGKHKGRPLERLSQRAFRMIEPVVPESLSVHPIEATRVAVAMAMTANQLYEQYRYQPQRTDKSAQRADTASQSNVLIVDNRQMLAMTRLKH